MLIWGYKSGGGIAESTEETISFNGLHLENRGGRWVRRGENLQQKCVLGPLDATDLNTNISDLQCLA